MESLLRYKSIYYTGIIIFLSILFVLIYIGKYEFGIIIAFSLLALSSVMLSFRYLLLIVSFLTPLTIPLRYFKEDISIDISLLTEPLLIIMLGVFIIKFLMYHQLDKKLFLHPITLSVFAMLGWILISALNSILPLVSIKYFIAKLWLIIPVLVFGYSLFSEKKNITYFIWGQAISLSLVVLLSSIELYTNFGLSKNSTHFSVQPFYDDHTAYGAVLALFIPVIFSYIFIFRKPLLKFGAIIVFLILLTGLILSYSRASWLGIVMVIGLFVLIKLRVNFKYLAIATIFSGLIISFFWFQIIDTLEKNNQDSSSNLSSHILSITNISTDASNVERLNRWYCALEMFKDRPLFGYGPGTYQFEYAPFQLKRMRTIISTNFGDVGNAHSEYLGAMAEQGLPGVLLFLIFGILTLYYSFKIYNKSKNRDTGYLALGIGMGFVTYFFHAFLNNFLHTDKLAIPFFGFITIIITLYNHFYLKEEGQSDVIQKISE